MRTSVGNLPGMLVFVCGSREDVDPALQFVPVTISVSYTMDVPDLPTATVASPINSIRNTL